MPKYLVETIDMFRMRYVIECESADDAKDTVTFKEAEEFSQLHLDETITSTRVIDDAEYLRLQGFHLTSFETSVGMQVTLMR